MAQRGSVPKFGNWTNNDVGYTAYFEKARGRGDGGPARKMTNPNDPEDNPNMNFPAVQKPTRASMDARGDTKNSARPPSYNQKPIRHPGESGYGSSSSRPPHPNAPHNRVTAVPKFGVWNEGNAAPGEGFTVTFNQIKNERTKGPNLAIIPSEPVGTQPMRRKKTSFMRKIFWFLYPRA
ncbi:RPM1-interacting protein 4-like [Typha angustifolia]|uniref:RPM1-interacting protein 4-like n=1 Tax=Typha angustifolia TaxID=59011 RepID=UPI003C2DB0EC